MRKFYKIILLLLLVFLLSCGIEDTLYFKEPVNIGINYDNDEVPSIEFYGYNQESESGDYLFVGYDIFYYFGGNADSKKRAVVYKPYPKLNKTDTSTSRNSNLITAHDIRGGRSIYSNMGSDDSYFLYIYQKISLPVTKEIINDVLYEGNSDNVVLYFNDKVINDGDYCNPYVSNETVIFDRIYPALDDYPDDYATYDDEFQGFLDIRYYKELGVTAEAESTDEYKIYKCKMYFVAKGLDSTQKASSLDSSLVESVKSSTIEVKFKVKAK